MLTIDWRSSNICEATRAVSRGCICVRACVRAAHVRDAYARKWETAKWQIDPRHRKSPNARRQPSDFLRAILITRRNGGIDGACKRLKRDGFAATVLSIRDLIHYDRYGLGIACRPENDRDPPSE